LLLLLCRGQRRDEQREAECRRRSGCVHMRSTSRDRLPGRPLERQGAGSIRRTAPSPVFPVISSSARA
jgi:hypothetical protein